MTTDATVTLDFAIARMTGVVDKLIVYPAIMLKNLDRLGGLVHSQRSIEFSDVGRTRPRCPVNLVEPRIECILDRPLILLAGECLDETAQGPARDDSHAS